MKEKIRKFMVLNNQPIEFEIEQMSDYVLNNEIQNENYEEVKQSLIKFKRDKTLEVEELIKELKFLNQRIYFNTLKIDKVNLALKKLRKQK